MQLNNTNSNPNNVNINNNGNLKLSHWQQQQQQQQQQPLANYTLPGVINYLTSEFTDLERFKIMTNLEKSEMKYKIVQLQGELNSLRYLNEKQKSRINVLEKENKKLDGQLNQDGDASKFGGGIKNEDSAKEDIIEIPEIDMMEIKKSRTQLTKSMKQVLHLLKTPHSNNINALNFPDPVDQRNEYDALINNDNLDDFCFTDKEDSQPANYDGQSRKYNNKDSIFSQYLNDIPFKSRNQKSTENVQEILSQNNLTEIGDVNDKSIQYLDQPLEEKEAFPSPNFKAEESDAETVIMDESDGEDLELTKTRSNHANQRDSKISMHDSPSKSKNPPESKQITDDAYSLKPKSSITTCDPDYEHCQVFANCLNDAIVYLNYDHKSDQKLISLNVWSTLLDKLIVSKELSDTIVEKPNNIIDIYCVSHDETNLNIYLLIIYKSGAIHHVKLNENSLVSKTCTINLGASLNSSKLIEFSHKSSAQTKNFGLVVTGVQKAGSAPFIKVYNLLIDASHSIIDTEIGSYVKSFFKLLNLQGSDMFEVVHWFKNDEANAVVDSGSPQSNKVKSHKRTISCADVSLSPYEIILKLGRQLIRFNIVLKRFYLLIDEQQCGLLKEVCFNDHLAVLVEINEDNFKLKVYDLAKNLSLSETKFNNSFSENPSLILVSDKKKYVIARLDRTHIQFYDLCFTALHRINVSPLPNTLLYSNGNIILATMSNNSIENLAIYDLNTFTA